MDQNNSNNTGSNPPENSENKTDSPILSPLTTDTPADTNKPSTDKPAENSSESENHLWDGEKKEDTPQSPDANKTDENKPLVEKKNEVKVDGPKPRKGSVPLILIIVFLIFSFVCGLLIAGWYFQTQLQATKASKATPQAVKQTIIIGTNATDPPMESINKQGALVGYDIDLGYRIANEVGAKAEFKNIEWDDLFKELLNKKIDMIMASVTITDERKKIYAFSDPYINAGQVIISRKDNPITSVSALQGKKIAVQKDTTNEKEAYNHTAKNLVLVYADYNDIAKAVSLGSAEAALSDLTIAKGLISNYDNVKITSDPFTNEYYGIVIRKEDKDLVKKVNDALTILRVNGILADLKQKWLD